MERREALRIKKEGGAAWPWSDDDILNRYKFTNVRREDDRTTRWMRANWTDPNAMRPAGEIIFNCALFRYFGTLEFAEAVGWQRDFDPTAIIEMAASRRAVRERVFTGAYIIPTLGLRRPKHEVVADIILAAVWENRLALATIAEETKSWRLVAEGLRRLPGFGGTGFMAKEVLQDVLHTPVLRHAVDRNHWCPAGPGARRGLNRIYERPLSSAVPENKLLQEMKSLYELSEKALADFMPTLELHDIQFQLCEFDKYERVRLSEGFPKALYRPPAAPRASQLFPQ